MASFKKTTGNLVWLFLGCMLVLVAPKFFFSQTESLKLQLTTTKTHACEKAEFFGGETTNGLPNYTKFNVGNYAVDSANSTQLISSGVLQKPFDVLRIDPCTRSGETVEIVSLTLISPTEATQLPLTETAFTCTNCSLQLSPQKTLLVEVYGADPQLVVNNLDQTLLARENKLLTWYQGLRNLALVILIVTLMFLGWQLFSLEKTLFIALFLSNVAAAGVFFVLYKKRFSLGFNLPFGDDIFQSGVAFMHLNMYSRYTDYVLYLIPLGVSLVVFVAWFLRNRKKK